MGEHSPEESEISSKLRTSTHEHWNASPRPRKSSDGCNLPVPPAANGWISRSGKFLRPGALPRQLHTARRGAALSASRGAGLAWLGSSPRGMVHGGLFPPLERGPRHLFAAYLFGPPAPRAALFACLMGMVSVIVCK